MKQRRLIAEPDVRVILTCPQCGHVWDAAWILPGTWWGRGVKPESIAKMCHCPKCNAPPPMAAREEMLPTEET